jgi:hypothetical protein
MIAAAIGGGAGGGGGVPLSAVIDSGQAASDWNNSSWPFGTNLCTPSGGTAPYTYAWSYSVSNGGTWGFAGSSTASSVAPTVSGVSSTATATLICTVTDAASNVVASNEAYYTFENIFF